MQPYSNKQKTNARKLRRAQTDAERKLWTRLRDRQIGGAKFRRQHSVGPFITDFCCVERGLVIELDGGDHAVEIAADQKRSIFLKNAGYRVLRFWDNEVLTQLEVVLEEIVRLLQTPSPLPSPKGRGHNQITSIK